MHDADVGRAGLADAGAGEATPGAGLRRLILRDYRSYAALDLAVPSRTVVVTGENGSGKTNLLEAVSLFAQGRGLRRAELSACARREGAGGFAVSIAVEGPLGAVQLGTGLDIDADGAPLRRHRLDREPAASARAFADHLRLVWLTPAMDGLFAASPGERRRFLDRLVLAADAEHGARVTALERALRQRNKVLEAGWRADAAWLDAIEREAAALGVAVAAARADTVARLAALLARRRGGAFPWARIALAGDVETLCASLPALEVEDRFRTLLTGNRAADAAAGRALVGPQAADLLVRHGPKDVEAALCSTGEQKALLVGLVLAHAQLVADLSGLAPVVLLDEIAAHLDARRRAALYAELDALPGQVWMTGADAQVFDDVAPGALRLRVTPGLVATA